MNRALAIGLTVLMSPAMASAGANCRLQSARGNIEHVIYITFDNTHLRRDNPNVPSDLEQMPHLLSFLRGKGALLSRHHTPLISHTGTDLLTALTGLYGDRHGVPVSNSFRYFNTNGTSNPASAFAYWTDPLYDFSTATPTDTTPHMIGADGKTAPAPWAVYTRAGCDVGAVASANIVLENIATDIATVFGATSPEAAEVKSNAAQANADFVGIAVHCAAGSRTCNGRSASDDLLRDEKGGYDGFRALFGHKNVAPALGSAPLVDLDGHVIADGSGHVGFPGFDGMSASVSLGYVATMQERGIPVTYAYISDAHDNHAAGAAFGPGEAGYVAQLAAYDAAFAKFFARLAKAGIDERNTLFVFTADEGDHFVGGAPSPAGCDGIHTPCTYAHIGELNVNLTGLLAAAGITTPWKAHSDSAPNLWLDGNPAADAPALRALERALAKLNVTNLLSGVDEKLANYLADRTEMKLLHMVSADAARTPTMTMFAKPDYFVGGGAPLCSAAKPCVTENPGFAWNHGDASQDITTTWLGVVGPGVRRVGETGEVWSDHADVRPTLLSLVGLRDDYLHQGRALVEIVEGWARPRHADDVEELGLVYKQLNAPVGALAMATLRISTKSLASGDSAFDLTFGELTGYLERLGERRDALATRIEQLLDETTFGHHAADRREVRRLADDGRALVAEARLVADFVDLLP
ncbi:MAG: hypothetical protein JWM53_4 [bacterium]|nr:hypothetical protein [bacterium]